MTKRLKNGIDIDYEFSADSAELVVSIRTRTDRKLDPQSALDGFMWALSDCFDAVPAKMKKAELETDPELH